MRILVISQYYPPESAMIPATITRSLAARGHQVKVLTGYPNYPEGRLHEGYRQRWRSRETDGDIDLLRVPLWVDHSQSLVRRALNYGSFGLSASTAFGFARDADVIYVYATQMTPALAPWFWRIIGGAPYVLHIQDLWPDSITGSSFIRKARSRRLVDSVLTPWIGSLYRHAAGVIGIAPTMVSTLTQRGVHPSKAHLVYNWADETPLCPPPAAVGLGRPQETHVLYGGNVGDMQDLENAVLAAHRAEDAGVRLTIVGDGVALPSVMAAAESLGATNVSFAGRVSRERMGNLLARADYALVTLKNLDVFRGTIPSKLQHALSHGTPVISTVQGDVRAFVEGHSVGFTAEAEDAQSLESAFRRAAALGSQARKGMADRAKRAYVNRFSLNAGVTAIEDILTQASQTRSRVGSQVNRKGNVRASS